MPTAANAVIEYEAANQLKPYALMDDSGDKKLFSFPDKLVSKRSGYEPVIRPDGIMTGSNLITPGDGSDRIDIAGFTCAIGGATFTVAPESAVTVSRGLKYIINSIVYDGADISVVTGTGHASAHNENRGTAGGPPSIPIGSIEIGQVRYSDTSSAPVTLADIYQTVEGGHVERYDYPLWDTPNCIGEGNAVTNAARKNAHIEFYSEIPTIHGATATSPPTAEKSVYAQYYVPVFTIISESEEFKPAETSSSVSSKQLYRKTVGSASESLGSGGFKAYVENGISDNLTILAGELLLFRFYPDINKEPFSVTQGYLALATSYPAGDQISVTATISAPTRTVNFNES